ncbi:MAG: 3-phenylpropionate/cinnamic acid dioxygenase subunit beta [Panacagrimonas sp.]
MNRSDTHAPESRDAALLAEMKLHHEMSQWLYREARALDEERFRDWLAMLAPDIHYWLPLRENRFRKDRRPEPEPSSSASVFNDDLFDLELRIKRFETGLVWSEDPAPRTHRVVSNVEVIPGSDADTLEVFSGISICRSRRQDEEVTFNARRRDRFRRIHGTWKLVRRHILATHHVFLDENVSVFF